MKSLISGRLLVTGLLIGLVALAGFGGSAWATSSSTPSGHSTVPTKTPTKTPIKTPTKTPKPSKTATPAKTPTKTPTPKVTKTPTPTPKPQLNLSSVSCDGDDVEFHFVVTHAPSDVKSYGKVKFVVNGKTYEASFEKRSGDTAHYEKEIDSVSNGKYQVTSATVTITTNSGQSYVVSLHNPGTWNVKCS
jgi:hypothetical protein